jgi:hypothetical protein
LAEAKQLLASLERDATNRHNALLRAEAAWIQLQRPLGATAFVGRLAGQINDQPLFAERLASHDRVGQMLQANDRLKPAADASWIDRAVAKAQQLTIAGKIKLEELRFAGLERKIGQQLIDSACEQSVSCAATSAVLEQVAARRREVAALRTQSAQAAAALQAGKEDLSQRLRLPAVGDSKSLTAEIERAKQQLAQAEKHIAVLDQDLPALVLAAPQSSGPIVPLIEKLRVVRAQLPPPDSTVIATIQASAMSGVKHMSGTTKLMIGAVFGAICLLVLCWGGIGLLGFRGSNRGNSNDSGSNTAAQNDASDSSRPYDPAASTLPSPSGPASPEADMPTAGEDNDSNSTTPASAGPPSTGPPDPAPAKEPEREDAAIRAPATDDRRASLQRAIRAEAAEVSQAGRDRQGALFADILREPGGIEANFRLLAQVSGAMKVLEQFETHYKNRTLTDTVVKEIVNESGGAGGAIQYLEGLLFNFDSSIANVLVDEDALITRLDVYYAAGRTLSPQVRKAYGFRKIGVFERMGNQLYWDYILEQRQKDPDFAHGGRGKESK